QAVPGEDTEQSLTPDTARCEELPRRLNQSPGVSEVLVDDAILGQLDSSRRLMRVLALPCEQRGRFSTRRTGPERPWRSESAVQRARHLKSVVGIVRLILDEFLELVPTPHAMGDSLRPARAPAPGRADSRTGSRSRRAPARLLRR